MSAAPNRNRSTNGGGPSHGNLFLETDPEALPTQSSSRRSARTRRPAPTRSRGLVVPIEESVTPAAAWPASRRERPAAYRGAGGTAVRGAARTGCARIDAACAQLDGARAAKRHGGGA